MNRIFPDKEYYPLVITLAYPVVLGMISRTIMSLVDVAMVGRLGAVSLAATGLGAHIVLLVTHSYGSLNVGIQTLTSRRYGEFDFKSCGRNLNGTLIVLAVIGAIISSAGYFSGPVITRFIVNDAEVARLGSSYVSIRFLEVFSFGLIALYRGFFDGIGKTKINMQSMVVINALNIVLNYCLIFGNWGFPRLEVTGAALASAISTYVGIGIMVFHSLLGKYRTKYGLYDHIAPEAPLLKKLVKLSTPVVLQEFFTIAGFLLFLKILSMIGTVELAASTVCISIMSMSFMPGYGLGTAAATLIGQNLGAKRADLAERYGWESVKLGVIVMGSMGVAFILLPQTIMKIFSSDTMIIQTGTDILRLVGFVQFIDAFGIVLNSCLWGAGMTRFVMIAEIVVNWGVFLPVAYLLGITLGYGVLGAWLSLALYMLLIGVIMTITFVRGTWKKIAL